ncbi:adenylate/guanylate cyclase domain-containing protein [bacterium]|nr:adenylate/guanylate cyclase domain-containing protein [bacterium]
MAGIGNGLRKTLTISSVSFVVSLVLFLSGVVTTFEYKAYDLFSRYLNPAASSGDVVIVQIDQRSIDALRDQSVTWPWPRQVHAPIFEYLSQADAVFFDVLTTEPSSYGVEDDAILAGALKKAGNVYLPVFLSSAERAADPAEQEFIAGISLTGDAPAARLSYRSAILPIPEIREACRGAGNVMIKPDSDGVYRKVPLNFGLDGHTIPHFVMGYLMGRGTVSARREGFSAAGKSIPLADGMLLLRFHTAERPFPVISAADLLQSYLDQREGRKPAVDAAFFKGKKVFIGLTAAGLYDLKPTAVSSISTGVLVHATALDNLLHGDWIVPLSRVWSVLFMLAVTVAAVWFILNHLSLSANLAFVCGAAAVVAGVLAVLFGNGLYLQIIPPFMALGSSSLIAAAYSYATEGKERRFVRRTFSQYMDETIVRHLLKNPELIRPGGRRKRVTVFFLDIAGFTPIAEHLPAEDTAEILHTLLNAFTEVVIRNHGVIDKYIGDCIMAFWGAPLETEQDETDACRAALGCLEALEEINRGFRDRGLTTIAIRIGIHSGDAVVGNLGSDRLFDYTVVGDTVNLAARLESANKQFGTRVLVSADTWERTGDSFVARELGLVEVKGKSRPVRIHEIMAVSEAAERCMLEKAEIHREALDFFYAGQWREAIALFDRILGLDPADGPSAWYRTRCEALVESPPSGDDWQVIRLKEK